MKAIPTILHPTDFSTGSEFALKVACALAKEHGARLVFLHAVPALVPAGVRAGQAASVRAEHAEEDLESYRKEMQRRLNELWSPSTWLPVEHRLKEGDPCRAILGAAEETSADVIVLGTHDRSEEERKAVSSVAKTILQEARCAVVLVREPRE